MLVDDDSTDNSGKIADEFGRSDTRFCVHHIENVGASATRNYGLDHSDGKYIMFADSDDWVADNFCEVPYKAAEENDAGMVTFGWFDAHTETDIDKSKYTFGGILDSRTAVIIGAVYC